MNEVTNQSLQPATVRTASVSAKPKAENSLPKGNELPVVENPKAVAPAESKVVDARQPEKERPSSINEAIAEMAEYTQSVQRNIEFSVDEDLGRTVVTVMDRETKEVIRQIPDEIFLKMARNLKESIESGTEEPLHLISAKA